MSMQTLPEQPQPIPANDNATPQKPRLERVGDSAKRPGSTDSLVDAALDALADPVEPPNEEREPQRAKDKRDDAERREPEVAPVEADEGEDDAQDAQGEEGAEQGEDDTRGTQADPFTVKDLPSDKYIEVKIDGQKEVVPLSELASGYIREQTFSRRLNESRALTERAQAMVQAAQAFPERLRAQFREWTQSPEQVLEFFLDSHDRENVLEKVARKYAEMRIQHREQPEARLAFERARDQRRLQQERERFEAEQRAVLEQRQQQEAQQRARAVWEPGWNEGLRRAGFPTVTPELQEEVMVRCRQRIDAGRPVTSDDIAEFVARAAKLLELPRGGQKPQPAPKPPPKPERPAARRQGDWDKVPRHQRARSVDFFLSGLKPRDFR